MNEFLDNLVKLNVDKRLIELREKSKAKKIPVIRDSSFNFLLNLVRLKKPQRILEIGMANGCSAIGMLLESQNSHISCIEINEDIALEAKKNFADFALSERVTVFIGDANEIVTKLTGNYDFIFLDGPKGHYREYLPYLLPILNKDGVLFADNVLFRGYVDGKEKKKKRYNTTIYSMQDFLKGISENEELRTTIFDIEDGVSVSVKIK